MANTPFTKDQILATLPQQRPFRFIDELLEVDEDHVISRYRFREDEFFYKGHFPGFAVTPGVILLETMLQAGVCLSIFLASLKMSREEMEKWVVAFTDSESFEVRKAVLPGHSVTVRAEKLRHRMNKTWYKLEMRFEDGALVAEAIASGIGVRRDDAGGPA